MAHEHGAAVEQTLTEYASDFAPDDLAKLARRTTDLLDPDGILHDPPYRSVRRGLTRASGPTAPGRRAAN